MEVTPLISLIVPLLMSGGLWVWLASGGGRAVRVWVRENLVREPDFDPDISQSPDWDAGEDTAEMERPKHHHTLIQCPAMTQSGTRCKRMGLPSWGGGCLQHARMQLKSYLEGPREPRNEALERLQRHIQKHSNND
jgi:hypothetical protein